MIGRVEADCCKGPDMVRTLMVKLSTSTPPKCGGSSAEASEFFVRMRRPHDGKLCGSDITRLCFLGWLVGFGTSVFLYELLWREWLDSLP